MNPTDLAWLAGFLDGEGCIGIYRHKSNTSRGYQLRVCVINTDLPSLLKFKFAFGGSIWEHDRKGSLGSKPCWEWQVTAAMAEKAVQQLLPYLVTKAPQGRIALRFRQTYDPHYPKRKGLSEEIRVSRAALAQELSLAKR